MTATADASPTHAAARPALVADLVVKVSTLGLIALALAFPDWDRFADKAMAGRAVAYPLALLVVPVAWLVGGRRVGDGRAGGRRGRFPAVADLLFSLPWLIDLLGNALDAFDRLDWFDDAAHFVNWALLAAALAVVLPLSLPRWSRVLLCAGLGCLAALSWEISEYYTFIRGGAEQATAYRDTLGDEVLGTLGALLAGLVVAGLRGTRSPATDRTPDRRAPVAGGTLRPRP